MLAQSAVLTGRARSGERASKSIFAGVEMSCLSKRADWVEFSRAKPRPDAPHQRGILPSCGRGHRKTGRKKGRFHSTERAKVTEKELISLCGPQRRYGWGAEVSAKIRMVSRRFSLPSGYTSGAGPIKFLHHLAGHIQSQVSRSGN